MAELISQADCVLAFGASLNRFTTYDNGMFPQARVVQVDKDAHAQGKHTEVEHELFVNADARLVAEALVAELERRGHSHQGLRSPDVAARLAEPQPAEPTTATEAGGIDPNVLARRLELMLPRKRVLAFDGGHHSMISIRHLTVPEERGFFQMNDAGSIGFALGGGIGAAVGRPDALAVVCIGDAGFMMSLGDLDTAVRHEIPMLILVWNDDALGAEVHYMHVAGASSAIARCPTPPIAEVARAMGAEAYAVATIDDLRMIEARLSVELTGPVVVDCHIDPTVVSDSIPFLFGGSTQPAERTRAT
jgi:thiamine pyrophosphate-dependent acetolactate synthase large subunit-like protein